MKDSKKENDWVDDRVDDIVRWFVKTTDKIDDWFDAGDKRTYVKSGMNKIIINGETIDVVGNNINVRNSKVMVDGVIIKSGLSGNVVITFEGDLASLDCTSAVINGNVHGNVDCTSILINGDVNGDVDGTTVRCGNVRGDVDGTTVKYNKK